MEAPKIYKEKAFTDIPNSLVRVIHNHITILLDY